LSWQFKSLGGLVGVGGSPDLKKDIRKERKLIVCGKGGQKA